MIGAWLGNYIYVNPFDVITDMHAVTSTDVWYLRQSFI